jgi:hypothetical protein
MRRTGVFLLILLTVTTAEATQTRRFVLDTPKLLAGATGRGVVVFPDGSLQALPPLQAIASFDEPLGLALAVGADGTAYVGTGHPARIGRIAKGQRELVGEPKADQTTALLLAPDGTLFAATASPALVLRLAAGGKGLEEVARLSEGNIWDLAWYGGGVVVAAGNPGRLLRLTGSALAPLATVPDRHARCLAVSGDALLVGTSGKGLVLRWVGDGPLGVVYDSAFTEIAALAVGKDGVVFAAGLTGDPTLGKTPSKADSDGEASVSVAESSLTPPTTDKGPATSEIVRIVPVGAATVVHRFTKPIAGTLAWAERGLVIGTGMDGELWQLVDGSAAQLDSVEAGQVVRLERAGEWVLAQGPVKLLRRSGPPHGTFTSPALDAGQPAQFGEARVQGSLATVRGCTVRFRSGAIAEPDDTWSSWSAPQPCGRGAAQAPVARFLQWQLELEGDSALSRVGRVEVAYRQVNLSPEIKELTVYAPAEVYLKTPPPADRVVEVQHPDLSGIFTVLDDDQERQTALGKKYYRVGFQSVSWKVEEPNGDPLRYSLEVQRNGAANWWKVRDRLETTVLAFDTQALADGAYRFRLSATDEPGNPVGPLVEQAISSWFVVDNSAPAISAKRDGDGWLITVEDALSPLVKVEWNRDANEWRALPSEDGLLDGRRERFQLPAQVGARSLAIRAVDDHHNRATIALEVTP